MPGRALGCAGTMLLSLATKSGRGGTTGRAAGWPAKVLGCDWPGVLLCGGGAAAGGAGCAGACAEG